MKFLFVLIIAASLYGCTKDSPCDKSNQLILASINLNATESGIPFEGALEIFPCDLNTAIYFGNYGRNTLSVINPSYIIKDGVVSSSGVPLSLPIGSYTFIYWGIDTSLDTQSGRSNPGTLRLGADLNDNYWSVRSETGGYYYPVFNHVFAKKNVTLGENSNIEVPLKRVVAGLNVIVKNKTNSAFDPIISAFDIYVSGIANRINFTTAEPDFTQSTVTIHVPLTISADRLQATNPTAMLFPSTENPAIKIEATLSNGAKKSYSTTLTNKFTANQIQTVTIIIDQILDNNISESVFTVSQWTEISEEINADILN